MFNRIIFTFFKKLFKKRRWSGNLNALRFLIFIYEIEFKQAYLQLSLMWIKLQTNVVPICDHIYGSTPKFLFGGISLMHESLKIKTLRLKCTTFEA